MENPFSDVAELYPAADQEFVGSPFPPLGGEMPSFNDEGSMDGESIGDLTTERSVSNDTKHNDKEMVLDIDKPQFSQRELEEILQFSRRLVEKRSHKGDKGRDVAADNSSKSLTENAQNGKTVDVAKLDMVKSPDGRCVPKKDHCVLSADQIKKLGELKFSISNKDVSVKLDSLHSVLVEAGLITLVNGLRVQPLPTESSQIGYTSAFVIYGKPQDIGNYFLNRFVADKTPYAISTHTEAIAIASDDLLCYNADKTQLLKLMQLLYMLLGSLI
jgi:hypothetical protein